jgi:hypothetical protein
MVKIFGVTTTRHFLIVGIVEEGSKFTNLFYLGRKDIHVEKRRVVTNTVA